MENELPETPHVPERKETVVYRETAWSKVLGVSLVALYVSFALMLIFLRYGFFSTLFSIVNFVNFYSFIICKQCRDNKFARVGFFLVILWLIVSNILSLIPADGMPLEVLIVNAALDFVVLFSFLFIFENEVGRGAVRPNIFFWLAMAALVLTYVCIALVFAVDSFVAFLLAQIFKILFMTFISIGKSARTYEIHYVTLE